jgi:hypothetical protein
VALLDAAAADEPTLTPSDVFLIIWARVCYMLWMLESGEHEVLDKNIRRRLKGSTTRLLKQVASLELAVQQHRAERNADSATRPNQSLDEEVRQIHHRVLVLLSCAVWHRKSKRTVPDAFEALGFRGVAGPREAGPVDTMLVTGVALFCSLGVLALGWILVVGSGRLPPHVPSMLLDEFEIIKLAVSTFIPVLATAGSVLYLRHWRIGGGKWQGRPRDLAIVAIGAIFVGFLSVMAVETAMNLGGYRSFKSIGTRSLIQFLPSLPSIVATAVFVLIVLRGYLTTSTGRRLLDGVLGLVLLGLSAALVGKLLLTAQQAQVPEDTVVGVAVGVSNSLSPPGQEIFIAAFAILGAVSGTTLGLFLPYHHRRNIIRPSTEAAAEELDRLRRAAGTRLGPTATDTWLFTPHRDLGFVAPAEFINYGPVSAKAYTLLREMNPPAGKPPSLALAAAQ